MTIGKRRDITGERFGKLIAVERYRENGKTRWLCKCDCGNEKKILLDSLIRGRSKSCGCYRKVVTSENRKKHGKSCGNRLYRIWIGMRNRCNNQNREYYKNYGGRGIKVCEEWRDFGVFEKWSFENGYEDELTIDRIDVNGDYEPTNCRWVTRKTQANNTRVNITTKIDGIEKTLSEHAEYYNVNYPALVYRYSIGLRDKDLLKTKKRKIMIIIDGETMNLKEWSRRKVSIMERCKPDITQV